MILQVFIYIIDSHKGSILHELLIEVFYSQTPYTTVVPHHSPGRTPRGSTSVTSVAPYTHSPAQHLLSRAGCGARAVSEPPP